MRVAPALRLFLPLRARAAGQVAVPDDGSGTAGHVIQAAGVPLTEVGSVLADGRPLPVDAPAAGVLDVAPPARPQPLGGPPRLLLDVHLGTLARRLRLLGVDTAYVNDADDASLVAQANAEGRLLLTQDRRLLMRRALRRGAFVRGSRPDEQLDDVLNRFALPLLPYTRCPVCGAALQLVTKADVLDLLEPGTRRTQHDFRRCTSCGRVYWHGAHAARLDTVVERALRTG